MGKLTEYIQTKKTKLEDIIKHNVFEKDDMKDIFLDQIENLDFFKYKLLDCEGGTYYCVRVRLDASPLKIKSAVENPYEVKIHSDGKTLIYNGQFVYNLDKLNWTADEKMTLMNLLEYLKDSFPNQKDPVVDREDEYRLDTETGKFGIVNETKPLSSGAIRTGF